MTLLPGQRNVNGVSNFIFGTNMGQQVGQNGILVTPAIQALIKAGNFQIIRIAIPAGKSDSFIDESFAAASACGCQTLVTLDLNSLSSNEHVVSYIGNRCNLYELGNEPNSVAGGSLTGTQYYTQCWSPQVPTLRALNPNAFFIGPTVTSAGLPPGSSFISDWLTLCAAAGGSMVPDAISHHHYPCTTTNQQAICDSRKTIFSSDFAAVDAVVQGILGHSLPICLTEWSVSGGSSQQPYCLDPVFVAQWVHAAIDNMISAGYALAMQFEGGTGEANGELDLIQALVAGFPPGPIYAPLVAKNFQYLGGGARHAQFMAHA